MSDTRLEGPSLPFVVVLLFQSFWCQRQSWNERRFLFHATGNWKITIYWVLDVGQAMRLWILHGVFNVYNNSVSRDYLRFMELYMFILIFKWDVWKMFQGVLQLRCTRGHRFNSQHQEKWGGWEGRRKRQKKWGAWTINKIYQLSLLLLVFIKETRSRGEAWLSYSFKVMWLESWWRRIWGKHSLAYVRAPLCPATSWLKEQSLID